MKMLVIEEKDRISWEELFQLKEKKLRKDLEILDRENKPQVAVMNMKVEKKKLPDNVTAEQNDRENLVVEQKKYLKVINALREELCFKHYVGVRLFSFGNDLSKLLKIKGFLVEKFQLLCTQAVSHNMQNLDFRLIRERENQEGSLHRDEGADESTKVLEKEHKFYQELHEDLIKKQCKSLNIYDVLKNDREIVQLIEGNLCEKSKEMLGGCIRKHGFEILKSEGGEVRGYSEKGIIIKAFFRCLSRKLYCI